MSKDSQNKRAPLHLSFPGTPEFYLDKISFFMNRRMPNPQEALKVAENGLAQHPDNIDLLLSTAQLLVIHGDREGNAEPILRKAFALSPKDPQILHDLGTIILNNSNTPERIHDALRYLTEAKNMSPNNPYYKNDYGVGLLRAGRLNEAMDVFRDMLKSYPDNPILSLHYGISRFKANINDEETRHHLKNAWSQGPEFYRAGYYLVASATRAGLYEEARTYYPFALDGAIAHRDNTVHTDLLVYGQILEQPLTEESPRYLM